MRKITRIARKTMLEINHPAEILHVRILYPHLRQGLIAKIKHLLEQQTAHHKPYGHGRSPLVGIVLFKGLLKICPIDAIGQQYQLMVHVNEINQSYSSILFLDASVNSFSNDI